MIRYRQLFFLFSFAFVLPVQANMVLDKIIVNFYSGQNNREDVEVFNSGKEPLYISANLFEISQAETENPVRTALTDPRSAGIIVSPNRFIVPPGQRKIVRLISTQTTTDKDKVYRLLIKPHSGKLAGNSKEKEVGIKITVGYELLIFVRPINYKVDLQVQRKANTLNLYNAGNTNFYIREISLCQDKERKMCQELGGKRLYAGQRWKVNLPQTEGIIFIQKSVGKKFSLDEY